MGKPGRLVFAIVCILPAAAFMIACTPYERWQYSPSVGIGRGSHAHGNAFVGEWALLGEHGTPSGPKKQAWTLTPLATRLSIGGGDTQAFFGPQNRLYLYRGLTADHFCIGSQSKSPGGVAYVSRNCTDWWESTAVGAIVDTGYGIASTADRQGREQVRTGFAAGGRGFVRVGHPKSIFAEMQAGYSHTPGWNEFVGTLTVGFAMVFLHGSEPTSGDESDADGKSSATSPEAVEALAGTTKLALVAYGGCALASSGKILCWGTGHLGSGCCASASDNSVHCFPSGIIGQGQSAPAFLPNQPTEVAGLSDVADFGMTDRHACALQRDGVVQCWGENTLGELGDGTRASRRSPRPVAGIPRAIRILVEGPGTCALVEDGTVWCWGNYDRRMEMRRRMDLDSLLGSFGGEQSAKIEQSTQFDPTRPTKMSDLEGVTDIVGNRYVACARTQGGVVRCWGEINHHSQYQEGPLLTYEIEGAAPAVQIVASREFGCVRKEGGEVACWRARQQDLIKQESRLRASEIPGLRGARSLAAGPEQICGVLEDGSIWCWGQGGPLFNSQRFSSADDGRPRRFGSIDGAAVLALPQSSWHGHACAIMKDTTLRCWGSNEHGQVGDGTRSYREQPVQVPNLVGVVGVHVEEWGATCAILNGQKTLCWGRWRQAAPNLQQ